MNQTLQNTIDRLPAILVHNAPSMMRRLVASMQSAIAARGLSANASNGALFLRVGEADLVREFGVAMAQAVQRVRSRIEDQRGSPPSLTLEPPGDGHAACRDAFSGSDALFSRLCTTAQACGVIGCDAYHKDVFLEALNQAFEKSRIDTQALAELSPYAYQALDAELSRVYGRLGSVHSVPATA